MCHVFNRNTSSTHTHRMFFLHAQGVVCFLFLCICFFPWFTASSLSPTLRGGEVCGGEGLNTHVVCTCVRAWRGVGAGKRETMRSKFFEADSFSCCLFAFICLVFFLLCYYCAAFVIFFCLSLETCASFLQMLYLVFSSFCSFSSFSSSAVVLAQQVCSEDYFGSVGLYATCTLPPLPFLLVGGEKLSSIKAAATPFPRTSSIRNNNNKVVYKKKGHHGGVKRETRETCAKESAYVRLRTHTTQTMWRENRTQKQQHQRCTKKKRKRAQCLRGGFRKRKENRSQ